MSTLSNHTEALEEKRFPLDKGFLEALRGVIGEVKKEVIEGERIVASVHRFW